MVLRKVVRHLVLAVCFSCLCLVQSCGRTEIALHGAEPAYVYNRVDELLAGDLDDTVRLETIERHLTKDSIGIGTTSRSDNGEVVILGETIFWVAPDDASVHELTKPNEVLPYCAVSRVPSSAPRIDLSSGDLRGAVIAKCRETKEPLLAVKITGEFNEVKVSIAKSIPREGFDFDNPGNCLAFFTEGQARWIMVGFYAESVEDQLILSVEGHPIHIHGINDDRSFGGHIQQATVKKAALYLEPISKLDLENQ